MPILPSEKFLPLRVSLKSTYCHTQKMIILLFICLTILSCLVTSPVISQSSATIISDLSAVSNTNSRETPRHHLKNSPDNHDPQEPTLLRSVTNSFQPQPIAAPALNAGDSTVKRNREHMSDTGLIANQPDNQYKVYSSVLPNSTNVETFVEGSGDGPVPASKNKVKFDDTEGEDDDDEDEDYDYKDSGSGQGNTQSVGKKTELETGSSSLIKKPILNELDPYNPFRQSKQDFTSLTTIAPIKITNYTPFKPRTTLRPDSTTNPVMDLDAVESKVPTTPQPSIATNAIFTTTTASPMTINQANKQGSSYYSTDRAPTNAGTLAPRITTTPMPNQHKVTTQVPTTGSPIVEVSKYHLNNTTSFRPNSSRGVESEYDYEEESEDEESEDSSNFEDNEPLEDELLNNKTLNASLISTTTAKPTYFIPLNLTTSTPISSTTSSVVDHISRETIQTTSLNRTLISHSTVPTSTVSTTVRPATSSSVDYSDMVDEEEEEEEEEEDEEPIEEDLEDDEGELTDLSQKNSPSIQAAVPIQSSTRLPIPPSTTTTKPLYRHPANDRQPLYTPVMQQAITTPSPSQSYKPNEIIQNNRPQVSTSTATYFQTSSTTTTTSAPMTISSTTTTTSTTTSKPTSIAATSATITTKQPSYTTQAATSNPISRQSWQTVAPTYSSTTSSINFVTSGRGRNTPTVSSRVPNIYNYGSSLQDDDTGLTRQIYDKAVEFYRATSSAIHVAVETIWPPSFEVNSSTFEPLLTQPLIFMLALGGAVMGLVLTMMLVVYIITYQIQPKDDVSIY